jgi:hypothetical protein
VLVMLMIMNTLMMELSVILLTTKRDTLVTKPVHPMHVFPLTSLPSESCSAGLHQFFLNTSHCDNFDGLSADFLAERKAVAKERRWRHCEKVLQNPLFCFPTTCAYEFCFLIQAAFNNLQVHAFLLHGGPWPGYRTTPQGCPSIHGGSLQSPHLYPNLQKKE